MPDVLGYNCNTAPIFQQNECNYEKQHASSQLNRWENSGFPNWYDEEKRILDNATDWGKSMYYTTTTAQHIPTYMLDEHTIHNFTGHSSNDACINKPSDQYYSCEREIYNIPAYHFSACGDIPPEQFTECLQSNKTYLISDSPQKTPSNTTLQQTSSVGTYDLRKCAGLTGEEAQKCFNYQNYNQMWNQGSAQERELAAEREACAGNPNACAGYQSNMRSYANNSLQNSISRSHDSQMVCVDKSSDGTCIEWVSSQDYAKSAQSQPSSYKKISQSNFLDYVKSFLDQIIAIVYNHSSKQVH